MVVGTGAIAQKVTPLLARSKGCEVVAVASRSIERAKEFCATIEGATGAAALQLGGAAGAFTGGEAQFDAAYVTLPNRMHPAWTVGLLERGVRVLCEKPLAWRAEQVRAMAATAGARFAEGFMNLHHPVSARLRAIAQGGEEGPIGRLVEVQANRCSNMTLPERIATRRSHAWAGGAMMDLGCYCLSFARYVAGEEFVELRAHGELAPATPGETKQVDGTVHLEGAFPSGVRLRAKCSIMEQEPTHVRLIGTRGEAYCDWPWNPPEDAGAPVTVTRDGEELHEVVQGDSAFVYQFERFVRGERIWGGDWEAQQARAMEVCLEQLGVEY
ncbi:MAG: Gfo/Idh/MocA family oxidoreductase [Phycisphaerales bacterium]|nr:Gfo/Idh/MocA family oxidoreductase [Phycisphaerales bacterium]